MTNGTKNVFITLALCSVCNACTPHARITRLVGETVVSALLGEAAKPLVRIFYSLAGVTLPTSSEEIVSSLGPTLSDRLADRISQSTGASPYSFPCRGGESSEQCRSRAAFEAERIFGEYTSQFHSAYQTCRSRANLSRDYTEIVPQITNCVADSGFREEVALIRTLARREVYN